MVHGHGLIQERNINTGEMVEFEVGGGRIEAVHMIPGWTHNIINLSEIQKCAEQHPDSTWTFIKGSVPDRIISISQPWLKPIVRGKAKAPLNLEQSLISVL